MSISKTKIMVIFPAVCPYKWNMSSKDNLAAVSECLPERLITLLKKFDHIEEIRLRKNNRAILTAGGRNILTNIIISDSELSDIFTRLCGDSVYSYEKYIKEGFIPFSSGCRIGICGIGKYGVIGSASDIDSVNIRISRVIPGVGNELFGYMRSGGFRKSILIFSPPAVGKTTLLRDIAIRLSTPPVLLKTALIDSRNELCIPEMDQCPALYVYKELSKARAIEKAIRTMSPQIIICDELGDQDDIEAVIAESSCGVPVIATAHGGSFDGIIKRKGFDDIYRLGIFDTYVLLKRNGNEKKFTYEIKERS